MTTIAVSASNENSAHKYVEVIQHLQADTKLMTPGGQHSLHDTSGLLLTGGPDIDPDLYGRTPEPGARLKTYRERDNMELDLLRDALQHNMPVLGICRGMQLINVAFGGTLIQDIPGHKYEKEDGTWESAYHQIYMSPGSKLAVILGNAGFLRVNSRHHQGLKEPQKATPLLASAYSLEDGYIEALESPEHDWVIGMQCHPERVEEVPKNLQRLFQGFVERSDSYRQTQSQNNSLKEGSPIKTPRKEE